MFVLLDTQPKKHCHFSEVLPLLTVSWHSRASLALHLFDRLEIVENKISTVLCSLEHRAHLSPV